MKSHTQIVVIGGGVVGCSVLYHLTRRGITDCVLLERNELTSGSTWHAAGGVHTHNGDANMAHLQGYTIKLYRELEEMTGQHCGMHMTGGIMVAGTQERLDYFKTVRARGRYLGLDVDLISVDEACALFPILEGKYFIGALYDPNEGHVDPSGVTHAYAKAARMAGAEINRFTPVRSLQRRRSGEWEVTTDKGVIICEKVVNAAGLWARELGHMVGIDLPLMPMEHHYLITESIPAIAARDQELVHCIDFDGEIYLRQEGDGLLLGIYEKSPVAWAVDGTPDEFAYTLLNPQLDRIAPSLEVAFEHVPVLAEAGIKKVVNGPFTFTPDGNPLVGPIAGVPGYYAACGVLAGFCQGGGIGLALADWIVDGDPGMDVFAMDVARFGDYATPEYAHVMAHQVYARRFQIPYPNEVLPAGRPLRVTPLHHDLDARGAVFGASYGVEQALWFAGPGQERYEVPTFRRSNAFAAVGAECHAVREAVGVYDCSGYAKYEISGSGAERWLRGALAGKIPPIGRARLAPMLNKAGRLMGDFTLARLAEDRFILFGSGLAETWHRRWFAELPDGGATRLTSLRTEWGGIVVAGPHACSVLESLTRDDLSASALPFFGVRKVNLALAPVWIARMGFSGSSSFEIWTESHYLSMLYAAVMKAGADFGIRPFGGHAVNALRLEKGFGSWGRDYTPDFTPIEAGLDRFIDRGRDDFIGSEAVQRMRDEGSPGRQLTLLRMVPQAESGGDDAIDAIGNETILQGTTISGRTTSGGYGHYCAMSLMMAYLDREQLAARDLVIDSLGTMRPVAPLVQPPYDPDGAVMRG